VRTLPRAVPIERAGPADLMFLALQKAGVPEQFGVILVLEPEGSLDVARTLGLLGQRATGVPRLRQKLVRVPPWCGAPVWIDDPGFRIDRHLAAQACPAPGDEKAMLAATVDLLLQRLPSDRPLWAARLLTGLQGDRAALVIVVQHSLADGLGGLAVLGALLDGPVVAPPRPFPVPAPSHRELTADSFASCLRSLAEVPRRARLPRSPRHPPVERIGRAAPCSLLHPTGPTRMVTVATADLASLAEAAHRHGATVNDALVGAVAGALNGCMLERGEEPPPWVIAVPVSVRRQGSVESPGNAFTEMRACVSGDGSPTERLPRVAAIMRARKQAVFRPSVGFVAALGVRALVASGAYRLYMDRQRFLHTVLTNVRGPTTPVTLAGAPVTSMLPLAVGGGGNVSVTFAALSYAGTLRVTVTADPEATPDQAQLTALLQAQLDAIVRAG
jgi:diacylglycerol O-acyltransferase